MLEGGKAIGWWGRQGAADISVAPAHADQTGYLRPQGIEASFRAGEKQFIVFPPWITRASGSRP